jgi:hypothetical protein
MLDDARSSTGKKSADPLEMFDSPLLHISEPCPRLGAVKIAGDAYRVVDMRL